MTATYSERILTKNIFIDYYPKYNTLRREFHYLLIIINYLCSFLIGNGEMLKCYTIMSLQKISIILIAIFIVSNSLGNYT